MKPRKPERVYAIFDGDKLAIFDYRVPVFWHKRLAVEKMNQLGGKGFHVAAVNIKTV